MDSLFPVAAELPQSGDAGLHVWVKSVSLFYVYVNIIQQFPVRKLHKKYVKSTHKVILYLTSNI